jgi:hypothetical protein
MSLLYKKLPYIKPHKIFSLVANKNGTVFFESSQVDDKYGRYSFIGINPVNTILSDDGLLLEQEIKICHKARNCVK